MEGRPGANIPRIDFAKLKSELVEKHGDSITDTDVLSSALYPKVFDDYQDFRKTYGPVDKLDSKTFFVGPDIAHENVVRILSAQNYPSIYYVKEVYLI